MSTDKNSTEGQDYYHGELVVSFADVGRGTERVVVERADPVVLATNELVDEWRSSENPHVQLDGDVVTFGTDGEGCGRVSYKIGGRHDQWTRVLVRADASRPAASPVSTWRWRRTTISERASYLWRLWRPLDRGRAEPTDVVSGRRWSAGAEQADPHGPGDGRCLLVRNRSEAGGPMTELKIVYVPQLVEVYSFGWGRYEVVYLTDRVGDGFFGRAYTVWGRRRAERLADRLRAIPSQLTTKVGPDRHAGDLPDLGTLTDQYFNPDLLGDS